MGLSCLLGSPLAGAASPGGAQSAGGLIQEGARRLEAREYHQAIKAFESALASKPGDPAAREGLARAHAGLGVEFANSGDYRSAREAFERSLRTAEDTTARFGLGYLDFLEMRDGQAKDNLERALSREPDNPLTHKLLALLDYRRGRTAEALRGMERAVRLDPRDQEAQAFQKRWAREEELRGKLTESGTRHFLVRADRELHPDAVREILNDLESIHDSIGQALGHWPREKIPVLFLLEADFYAATGSHHWIGGLYDGQIKLPLKLGDGKPGVDRRTLLRTLRHEYVHALVKEICPGCPNWLNEGIAQYFEIENDRGGSLQAERALRLGKVVEELLRNPGRRIPFGKVPPRMWEISDQSLARWTYLQGLGFVSYLVDEHKAFRLRLLLSAYRREGSLQSAFQLTYGAELSELEDRWWKSLEAKGSER